jgi:hypothetical protein
VNGNYTPLCIERRRSVPAGPGPHLTSRWLTRRLSAAPPILRAKRSLARGIALRRPSTAIHPSDVCGHLLSTADKKDDCQEKRLAPADPDMPVQE